MELNAPILDQPDSLDNATTALIQPLRTHDIEEDILQARKGNGRDDDQSDAGLASATYQQELQRGITSMADERKSRSLAQAVISDAALLHVSHAQEDIAVRDRALAVTCDTSGAPTVTPEQTTAENALDDGIIARLATLYVSDGNNDLSQDVEPAAAKSSAWAVSCRKPSAVVLCHCTACNAEKPLLEIFQAPCGHDYCQECLSTLFRQAITDETLHTAPAKQVLARRQARVDAIARAQEVNQAIDNLGQRHDCAHTAWRHVIGQHQCEECHLNSNEFIFECRQCGFMVCPRCRLDRFKDCLITGE
ncbi:hypothetical protein MMC07_007868 [Pseudocyphellaria aurata]|nr:hypothetical protein [Pseudocyphellaria aurata]